MGSLGLDGVLTGVRAGVGTSGVLLLPTGGVRGLLPLLAPLALAEDLGQVLGDAVHVGRLTAGQTEGFVLNLTRQLGGVNARYLLVGLNRHGEFPQHRVADLVGVRRTLPRIKKLISDGVIVFKVVVVLRALVLVGIQRIEVIKLRVVNLIKESFRLSSERVVPISESVDIVMVVRRLD